MLIVAIATSLTSYIPIMSVPTFQIGEKVIKELKSISTEEIFSLVSSNIREDEVQPYTNWSWKFQEEQEE